MTFKLTEAEVKAIVRWLDWAYGEGQAPTEAEMPFVHRLVGMVGRDSMEHVTLKRIIEECKPKAKP